MTMAMIPRRINTRDYVDGSQSVVDSASQVADEVSRRLNNGQNVVLSVRGVRGVSSTFFNVILNAVAQVLGTGFASDRFSVETDTETQEMIYRRSLEALRSKEQPLQ